MLIVKLWNFFKGYVILKVEGFTLEKFLNLVVKEDIFIWDVHHRSSTCLFVKVSKKDFSHLKSIIRKVSCRLEIIDKRGVPFIFWKMRKRKFLVGGATFGLIIVYVLTSLIWTIEIHGSKNIDEELLIKQLNELGVKEGEFKSKYDLDELENQLFLMNHNLSYIHIDFRGTKMKIEVAEKETPPSIINTEIPTNVIADRDGIIEKILVYGGEAAVKEGDLVKKGDILISGEVNNEGADQEYEQNQDGNFKVHAWGDVFAKTWYETEVEVNSKIKDETSTNNRMTKKSLVIGDKEIIQDKNGVADEKYDKIEKSIPIVDFMGVEVPIYIKKTEYVPIENFIELSESEILERALEDAEKKIEMERKKKIDIINSTAEIVNTSENIYRVKIIIEAVEKISILEEIR